MDYSFLSPVQDRLVDELELQHSQTIGKKLSHGQNLPNR